MKVLILDGSCSNDSTGERVLSQLKSEMHSRDWEVAHILLRNQKIGNCAGDFFCWIRTPGLCNINDDNCRIARAVIDTDLLVYLTPVTFGGYSSVLKRMVDHLTQNNLPFFKVSEGEIHHPLRYGHAPKLLAIGWIDKPEAEETVIFHHLVRRNAINIHFPTSVSLIIQTNQRDEDLAVAIRFSLEDIKDGRASQGGELPRLPPAQIEQTPIQRALLLVGSPRGRKSTSQALGGYLFEQFSTQRLQTETVRLYPALGSNERMGSLLERINASNLIVLAIPLYIDSMPGPVTRALELIAASRVTVQPADETLRPVFAVIVNSGLPEAEQNQTALAICAQFARQAAFSWASSLALAGGYGLVNGTPLEQLGWRGKSIRASLESTAINLVSGNPIPDEAVRLMAKQRISKRMILLLGPIGWLLKARKFSMITKMWRQPYLS